MSLPAGSRAVAWLETGTASRIRSARRGDPLLMRRTRVHHWDRPAQGVDTAAVIDRDEQLVGELSVIADRRQRERLLRWAAEFEPRVWAVEGATGHGVAGATARRVRRDGAGRAGRAFGTGAAVGLGSQGQDRPLRRALGRDRRVTEPEPAFGCCSRITARSCGSWLAGTTSSRGSDSSGLSAARGARGDDRRRLVEESQRSGFSRAPQSLPGRRDRDRTETDRGRVPRRVRRTDRRSSNFTVASMMP